MDVVCIKLNVPHPFSVFPINSLSSHNLRLGVGNEVFVLGYPMSVGPGRFPVWKRASIATEPDIDIESKPLLYIDTATASGMSGSPVIRRTETGIMEDGGVAIGSGNMTRFIGIYSGRLISAAGSIEAQLGFVWKARVIEEIIHGGTKGLIR